MNAIGGTSIHYWAQSWRFHPWDFRVRSEVTRRYGANAIPAGTTLEDWPLTYDELEPYYDLIEHEVGVSGKAGNLLGNIDPRGNIFEGPRRREYPMPPLRDTGQRSIHNPTADAPGAHCTAIATAVAATSMLKTRPPSPPFRQRSRRRTSQSPTIPK
jgi:gluconate 2-dehydrogenase alpha chain